MEGHLIAPVYLRDHQVLAVNTPVSGTILARDPVRGSARTRALLDGDFTPLVTPRVAFDTLTLPDGTALPMKTAAVERDSSVIRMSSGGKRPSLRRQATAQIEERKREVLDTLRKPNFGDRARRWVYSQLPWHPQMIWTGTEYDADLTAPLSLPQPHPPAPLPVLDLQGRPPIGVIQARLVSGLDSATTQKGAPVEAVLTSPLLTPDKSKLILPEGTKLDGTVLQTRPARWLARNGRLRFSFRKVELPGAAGPASQEIHGQLSAAEAAPGQHVQIDAEGSAKSTGGRDQLIAPLALGLLAATTFGDDAGHVGNSAVTSNGFGLAARIVAMSAASPAVSRGFAFFALSKSIWYRWIAKGHELTFPKDTRLEITLNER
uniref:Uncharacterized protein n=2 Tax=Paracidobacterium acidisoli TaxID=2303751 RepID=A0A372IKB4_9BACT